MGIFEVMRICTTVLSQAVLRTSRDAPVSVGTAMSTEQFLGCVSTFALPVVSERVDASSARNSGNLLSGEFWGLGDMEPFVSVIVESLETRGLGAVVLTLLVLC